MAKNFTTQLVVAAALQGSNGHWLMHCRPEGKAHAGLWEFPGGKVEQGETPTAALVRELQEETGLLMQESSLREVGFAVGAPDISKTSIVILLYTASTWAGELVAHEGGRFDWFDQDGIEQLAMPPLDVLLARQLFEKSG